MTTQPQSLPTHGRPPRRITRQLGATAAGIALVLLVAAGITFWQVTQEEQGSNTFPDAAVTAPAPAITPRDQPARTYYIVASQAQADAVQQPIYEWDSIQAMLGTAPLTASVVLLPSVEAEVSFWSVMGEQERAGTYMDPVTVVDLRAPAAPVPPLDPAAFSDQELYQRSQPAPATLRTDTSDTLDGALATPPRTGPAIDQTTPAGEAAQATTTGGLAELYAMQEAEARAMTNAVPDLDGE
jgi:hypothetical protein